MKKNERGYVFVDFETTGVDDDCLPIEIGMVFCDSELKILELYQSYIKWDEFNYKGIWERREAEAFKIHNIDLLTLKNKGKDKGEIVREITRLIKKCYINYDNLLNMDGTESEFLGSGNFIKPVLCSDCLNFEWKHMKKLFNNSPKEEDWPFHYSGRDTNILTDWICDDISGNHSALIDALCCRDILIKFLSKDK